ncbi:hypothetical protein BSKO_14134 [Bryopsis sp. KO-2023]|nr:hypothetical protein BSKO_14134 [Bryopsis sp. KO-2023]
MDPKLLWAPVRPSRPPKDPLQNWLLLARGVLPVSVRRSARIAKRRTNDFHQRKRAETVRRRSEKSEAEASVAENTSVGTEGEKKKKGPTFMEAEASVAENTSVGTEGEKKKKGPTFMEAEASVAENTSVGTEGEKKKKGPTFVEALKTVSKS